MVVKEMRNAYRILLVKALGKQSLGILRRGWLGKLC
jgi:hypothetical protein